MLRRDVVEHLPALRRYALVLARDRDRAEDLVQEALVKALAGAATWRPDKDLRRWLFSILHNVFVSQARRSRTEAKVLGQVLDMSEAACAPQQAHRIAYGETVAMLMALPLDQRSALVMVAVEGLSYRDAAEALDIPLGTLMSRIARGREALRSGKTGMPERPPLKLVE